jgi:hypothetical protein
LLEAPTDEEERQKEIARLARTSGSALSSSRKAGEGAARIGVGTLVVQLILGITVEMCFAIDKIVTVQMLGTVERHFVWGRTVSAAGKS